MIKNCLIDKNDCIKLQNTLYHKRNNLVVIENNIDRNSESFSEEELEIFIEDCKGTYIILTIINHKL